MKQSEPANRQQGFYVCSQHRRRIYVCDYTFARIVQMMDPTTESSQLWWEGIVRDAERRSYSVSFVAIKWTDELMSRCTAIPVMCRAK